MYTVFCGLPSWIVPGRLRLSGVMFVGLSCVPWSDWIVGGVILVRAYYVARRGAEQRRLELADDLLVRLSTRLAPRPPLATAMVSLRLAAPIRRVASSRRSTPHRRFPGGARRGCGARRG